MTVDRRLRSGDAPLLAMACIWLLTGGSILTAALLWPQRGVPEGAGAILLAAVSSLAALAVAMFALGQAAWRLLGREACLATSILLPLNPLVLSAFSLGADPATSWQLAAAALAVAFLAQRAAVRGAALAGVAIGVGAVLQPGLWLLAAAIGVLLFARWLRDGRAAGEFSAYLKAGTAMAVPLLLVQQQFGSAGPHLAAPLPVGAGLAVLLLGTLALQRAARLAPGVLLGGMAATGSAALGAAMLAGSGGATFAPAISFTSVSPWAMLPAAAGLGACLYLRQHNQAWLRRWWGDHGLILAAAAAGAAVQPGLLPVAALLAAMPLGWLAAQLLFMCGRPRRAKWWPAPLAAALVGTGVFSAAAAMPPQKPGPAVIAYADTMPRLD